MPQHPQTHISCVYLFLGATPLKHFLGAGGKLVEQQKESTYYGCVITAQPTHLPWITLDLRE